MAESSKYELLDVDHLFVSNANGHWHTHSSQDRFQSKTAANASEWHEKTIIARTKGNNPTSSNHRATLNARKIEGPHRLHNYHSTIGISKKKKTRSNTTAKTSAKLAQRHQSTVDSDSPLEASSRFPFSHQCPPPSKLSNSPSVPFPGRLNENSTSSDPVRMSGRMLDSGRGSGHAAISGLIGAVDRVLTSFEYVAVCCWAALV